MDEEQELKKPSKRLCSEIQLFDLCELESCKYKVGGFCENPELLARFERIAEEDEQPIAPYLDEDSDGLEEDDFAFGDDVNEEGYDDGGWEE
ncbi:MAG TPA: hypothetical protein VGJ93_02870 [Desulfuromonadaceae bacterium]